MAKTPVLSFDSTTDHVNLGHLPGLNEEHSVEFWIKVLQPAGVFEQVMSKHAPGSDRSPGIWIHQARTSIHWRYNPGNKGINSLGPNGGDDVTGLTAGEWYHVAGVKKAKKLTLYLNGEQRAEADDLPELMANGNGDFRLGASAAHGSFIGELCEVRVWNVALTETDIQGRWNKRCKGDELGLYACWPLNEGVGVTVNDLSPSDRNGTLEGAKWVTSDVPFGTPVGPTITVRDDTGRVETFTGPITVTSP